MKKTIATLALVTMAATPAAAINLGGNSNTNVNTAAAAASANQAQQQGQMQGQAQGQFQTQGNSQTMNVQDRLQAVPASAPSMSSGHPCQKTGVSFGLGLVGGGGSAGVGGAVDEACMLAQLGYTEAAIRMIANRSPEARKALIASGDIVPAPAASASTRSTPATAPRPEPQKVAYTSCKFADGAIRVGVRRGASEATRTAAVSQCKATLQ